jgi:hypothetical protein
MLTFCKKIILFSILILFIFLQYKQTFAEESISSSPEIPRIGQPVTINVYSDSINLNLQKITWYTNDKFFKEGVGEKEIIFKNNTDNNTKIKAVITKSDNSKIELSTQISPAEIDLIIEPLSYVPPFYKGKSSFIEQGTFFATVVPNIKINGKKIESKNIFYKWVKDGVVIGSLSGVGQDSIKITGSIPIMDIELEVSAYSFPEKELLAEDSIFVETNEPKVLFYEKNPLYGILYNKTVSDGYYIGERNELNVVAEPFFFDFLKNTDDKAEYVWEINNTKATSSLNKNELLLIQQSDKIKGNSNISVNVSNIKRTFQEISNSFNLEFGK